MPNNRIRLRALNGQHVTFTLENAGWRFGEIHLEGIALPGRGDHLVRARLRRLRARADRGGRRSRPAAGGLVIDPPAGLEGALTVKRLRLRVRGDDSAPRLKIDGFFLGWKSSVLLIEGGYYSEREESDTSITEFGFTGTVSFHVGKVEHRVMVDLLHGHGSSDAGELPLPDGPSGVRRATQPIAGVELRGARVLYANNMKPKLREVDRDARELRYYRWYLDSDPLTVPGDRRLAAWEVIDDAWAWGVGASASFVALGRLVVLDLFVLGIHSPAEHGMLFSARVFAIAPEPLGFLAIEWDRENDRTSAVLAVNVTMASFVKDAPGWLAGAGGLKGSLFLSNDPATLAIGRLADQKLAHAAVRRRRAGGVAVDRLLPGTGRGRPEGLRARSAGGGWYRQAGGHRAQLQRRIRRPGAGLHHRVDGLRGHGVHRGRLPLHLVRLPAEDRVDRPAGVPGGRAAPHPR